MNKKYVVRKMKSFVTKSQFYSVDVYLEDEDGFVFICECGDWNNEDARKWARAIAALLNATLIIEEKCQ